MDDVSCLPATLAGAYRHRISMAIRVLIVDADVSSNERLRALFTSYPELEIVGECASAATACAMIREVAPQAVFLDAALPDGNGFDAIDSILRSTRPLLVALSTTTEATLRAFKSEAIDYVVKPFTADRLRETIERVRRQVQLAGEPSTNGHASRTLLKRVLVRQNGHVIVVPTSQIDWMESANNYIVLHVGRESHVVRETLTNLEQQLCPSQFLRISRFAIVNLDRIRELRTTSAGDHVAVMADGMEVPLTRGIREVQEHLQFA
jgi:two-component system LytT family response regulator